MPPGGPGKAGRGAAAALWAALLCGGCAAGGSPGPCRPGGDGTWGKALYETLDGYCMVTIEDGEVKPAAGVLPYDLNTPLFSDYAVKRRTVWMPGGKAAQYDPTELFAFPDGTILTKSFGVRDDLRKPKPAVRWIETRVLLKAYGDWTGASYTWNDTATVATLAAGGGVQQASWIDASGATVTDNYLVPSLSQCKQCHEALGTVLAIGPKARNLNRDYAYPGGTQNQIERWTAAGFLAGAPITAQVPRLPVWDDPSTGSLAERARAYLEVNCAHCHSAVGTARTTGLSLLASETDPARYGICKQPVAAGAGSGGNDFDIVPGDPDHSILVFRISTTDPAKLMPQIGRGVVDVPGVQLVRDWVGSLSGVCR